MIAHLLFITLIFLCSRINASSNLYPRYHLAPPKGWMNDPNGFCFFNGEYHLFYQYNPESSYEPGIAHWGHAKSVDLFHWDHLPIAMYPDQWYDVGGVFSGSCIVEDNTMHLYYTGNVNHKGETPDHNQYQALATSTDGLTVTKFEMNPVINGSEYQPDLRDPKVWKHGDKYYMVLGNSFIGNNNEKLGRALLWVSTDKINWEMASVLLESDGKLGYMFECPDFFELDGYHVLLFSPQGIKPEGDKYRNLYQTGYVIGKFDYDTNVFTPIYSFKEFDHGHDLYATQTTLDADGNRIVVCWMDMWDQNYPEMKEGFTGHMTIPRVISLTKDGRILQKPVKYISEARGRTIHSGKTRGDKVITLDDNTAEIIIETSRMRDLELLIESNSSAVKISYNHVRGIITLDRGGNDGVRRTNWKPKGKLIWKIYIDGSSIELFCGDGEVAFSSRFFPTGPVSVRLGKRSEAENMRVSSMKRTIDIKPEDVPADDVTNGST
ncbi:raffinose invertase-like [Zerene cesonia]|uniref:raffinose invertase-like n=1 Tax=Zerene cesonia TaxID=33412 RepID=UPI0018E58169|nr:raffinose invertase-like [Zerene cesonia]